MNQKQTVDMNGPAPVAALPTNAEVIESGLALLVQQCYAASYNRGWWHDPITGLSLIPGDNGAIDYDDPQVAEVIRGLFPYVIATKIALIHSEVSEGLEAYRVDAMDDKIPFPGITAEMGDAVIRIADLMGCLQEAAKAGIILDLTPGYDGYNLGAAILTKLPVNVGRPDHDLEKRAKPGGKKF